MPFNGSGVFSFVSNSWSPAVSATTIDSADWNTLRSDLATAISTAICKDGQTTITANLPMSTYRHTGVSNATALDQYATADQVVDNALCYGGASAAGTDTYAVNLAVSPGAYAAGQRYSFIADVANTGACTINFNTIGAASIKLQDGTDPHDNAIIADQIVEVEYDGTNMVLLNPENYNPNQASTAQGGATAADGANTWAKLAEFALSGSDDGASASYVLLTDDNTQTTAGLLFNVSLLTASSAYDTASRVEIISNSTPNVIPPAGIKFVAASTAAGTVVQLWVNKSVNDRKFILKELAKTGFSSITYYTDSAWQSADPNVAASAFEVVSSYPGAWANLTLVNGWTGTLRYRRNDQGFVEIRGIITAGTTTDGTTMFTAPAGFRPLHSVYSIASGSVTGGAASRIVLGADGTGKLYNWAAGAVANSIAITYLAEQ